MSSTTHLIRALQCATSVTNSVWLRASIAFTSVFVNGLAILAPIQNLAAMVGVHHISRSGCRTVSLVGGLTVLQV
jgi:hypothetical protein